MHPELDCAVADWDHRVYGNHRIVVSVSADAEAVQAEVPWRRRGEVTLDRAGVIVLSLRTGRRVRNAVVTAANAERGHLVFEPIDGPGEYAVHYLPYVDAGSHWYPQASYLKRLSIADPAWSHRHGADRPGGWAGLPVARAVRYEAASAVDSFAPIGFAATAVETAAIVASHGQDAFLLFGEDRRNGLGRAAYLPARWALAGAFQPFHGAADRGEFYVFQVGLYAVRDLTDVQVSVDLPFAARSLATGGTDARGNEFSRTVTVAAGQVQPLWIGVDIPADARPGVVAGSVTVTAGDAARQLPVRLEITDRVLDDSGTGDLSRLARLGWLDSTLAQDDEVVAPYQPVEVDGRRLRILGRVVDLAPSGLPAQIVSHFTPEQTGVQDTGRDLLAGPMTFEVGSAWQFGGLDITQAGPARVTWAVAAHAGDLRLRAAGTLEADGCLEYRLELSADAGSEEVEATLRLPVRTDASPYLMGLGLEGRRCPDDLDWAWDVAARNQDSLWIGGVDAGVQLSLRDEHYERPLNTNYYRDKPLVEPRSWANEGRGGVRLRTDGATRRVEAFSGRHRLAAGQTLRFDVRLLITPFRPITPRRHLSERYLHAYAEPAEVATYGANVVNLHHATPVNPYINDPLLSIDEIKRYVADAHDRDIRVKVYDTVRELTRHTPEVQALASLGDEVFASGPGGGHVWLQEHLDGDYVPGWVAATVDDVAIVTTGDSRWHNAYVCGVDRLVREAGIDGLYLDDVAFDRVTMKRVRKVLGDDPLVDLHSARQYTERDGYASSANLYLELLPYVDRLWLGEYVDYENTDPAYWLVEVSGIPFGLMGEMLQDGGNPWRGMVFGMTGRAPSVDVRPLWRAWDRLGLADADMVGWWVDHRPVNSGHEDVLATTWVGTGRSAVALASWAPEPVAVRPEIDWDRLGLEPGKLTAPAIDGFQEGRTFGPDDVIVVAPGKGWLLELR